MGIARKNFNMDPKKGMEYLMKHGLIKATPDAVAEFLFRGEGSS